MFSELIQKEMISPNYGSRDGESVTKITIHHAAGVINAEPLARIFENTRRNASCNYAIGNDGVIIGVVPEEMRSFCSTSRWNDSRAITIEVGNSTGAPTWEIGEKAMKSLILLCADICRRYCIVPYFNGTTDASMTFHHFYTQTECPGPYVKNHIKEIIARINNELCMIPTEPTEPAEPPKEDSYLVKVTCDDLNIRSGPGTKFKKKGHITDHGVYTIIETSGNWGKLKSGAGWICLKYTKGVK